MLFFRVQTAMAAAWVTWSVTSFSRPFFEFQNFCQLFIIENKNELCSSPGKIPLGIFIIIEKKNNFALLIIYKNNI